MSSLLPVLSYADDSSDEDSIELDGEMGEMNPEATMLATASMSLPTGDTVVPGSCCIRCQAKRHRAWWWIVPSVFMEVFAAGLVRAIIPVVIVAFFKSTSLGYFNGDGGDSIGGGGAGSFYPTSDSGATTSAQATDHRDASFFFMSSSESLRVIISMAMAPMLASLSARCSRRWVAVFSAILCALPYFALAFGAYDGAVYVYFIFVVLSGLGASSDARSLEYIRSRTLAPVATSKKGCGVRCALGSKAVDLGCAYAAMQALGVGGGFLLAPLVGVLLFVIAQGSCWLPFMAAFLIAIGNAVYLGAVLPTKQLDDADAQHAAESEGGRKVSVLLCTVTLYANLAHSLTCSP
jgi:hypothetical protein